ncbi:MAG: peptidoglycan-binding protein [Oscillospiraceae bacterium]|nr:peptidoglycan-binding protein [Oscillospiraceae bacterium]
MTQYETLSLGSQGDKVKKLQQSLINAGYDLGEAGADGDFGELTQTALKQFQTDVGITADGVAGSDTLDRLYTGGVYAPYDPKADRAYMEAIEALRQHSQNTPTYENSYGDELESLYQQIVSRPEFSYDLNSDALYQQYKDQYIASGLKAMNDSMAQASGLTGGYASTYSQAVGSMQYGEYMKELTAMIPQLYDRALSTYQLQGDRLNDSFAATKELSEEEYKQYEDALSQYNFTLNYLSDQAQNAYDTGFESWQAGIDERNDAYKKLTELMSYSGYVPTVDDLERSGMTRAQADAYLKAWQVANPLTAYLNGSITAEEYAAITGENPPGVGGGGGGYGGYSSKKKKKTEQVNKFDIVNERAKIEADYNAGRIDYDDREQLVNKLYGW